MPSKPEMPEEAVEAMLAELLRVMRTPELESERVASESAEEFVARRSLAAALPALHHQWEKEYRERLAVLPRQFQDREERAANNGVLSAAQAWQDARRLVVAAIEGGQDQ